MGDSMGRYPERCFHIIVPGQPKFMKQVIKT